MADTNIVFIGGTGRCGTNILRKIFDKHPDVATLPFEYRFIIDPDGLVDYYSQITWSPYMADKRLKRLMKLFRYLITVGTTEDKYADWELEEHIPYFNQLAGGLIGNLRNFLFEGEWVGDNKEIMYYSSPKPKEILKKILGNFINNVVNAILEKRQKKIYIEDNTWNILFAKELFELVPGAKLIHITRNYLDVVASFKKQKWCPSDTAQAATMYRDIMGRWYEIRDGLNYSSYFEVEFESLINDTESTLKRLCNFIELPFDEKMLDMDLSNHNIGRYKKELTKEEQKLVKEIVLK